MFQNRYSFPSCIPANRNREDSRRPSADLVARFKEQHFTEDHDLGIDGSVKKESNEMMYVTVLKDHQLMRF